MKTINKRSILQKNKKYFLFFCVCYTFIKTNTLLKIKNTQNKTAIINFAKLYHLIQYNNKLSHERVIHETRMFIKIKIMGDGDCDLFIKRKKINSNNGKFILKL